MDIPHIYKVSIGGVYMKQKSNLMITGVLYIVLVLMVFQAAYAGYNYYKGPAWLVESYGRSLEKGDYAKAYKLLNAASLDQEVSEKQMLAYYQQLYADKLLQMQQIGKIQMQGENLASCKVIYSFKNQNKEEKLQLVKSDDSWKIVNPFKSSKVTIYAPALSNVYINGKKIAHQVEGSFVEEGLLPGNYMLQVVFPQKSYKDYHQVIKVPEQTEVVLPYDMVNVGIQTVKGMAVNLGGLSKVANKTKVNFSDILPGEYTLTIKSPYDTITPIEQQLTIGGTNCNFNYKEMALSEKGHTKWKDFINTFYNAYLTGIENQEVKEIASYFEGNQQKLQLQLFDDWFIKDKDIQSAKLKVETQLGGITQEGYLQSEITEIVELTNLEEVEGGKENKVYRLILTWHTQIDIMKEDWQIANRSLEESIIAYQTEDGRWIQY